MSLTISGYLAMAISLLEIFDTHSLESNNIKIDGLSLQKQKHSMQDGFTQVVEVLHLNVIYC